MLTSLECFRTVEKSKNQQKASNKRYKEYNEWTGVEGKFRVLVLVEA